MRSEPLRWTTDELLAQAQWLAQLARRLVADPSEADDVVQETWVAALRSPPERARPLRPWLARVARNLARMRRRSAGARARREATVGRAGESAGPDELAQRLEGQRLLVEALATLHEPQRSTLLLHHFEHLSSEEIARRQGVSAGTVRWRLSTAMAALRAELDRRHRGARDAWVLALAPLARFHDGAATAGSTALAWPGGALLLSTLCKLVAAAAAVVLVVHLATRSEAPPDDAGRALASEPAGVTFAPIAERVAVPAEAAGREPATAGVPSRPASAAARPAGAADRSAIEAAFFAADGAPLAGIALELVAGEPHPAPPLSTRDGTVRLEVECPGEPLDALLLAHAPGWASRTFRIEVEPGATAYLGNQVLVPGGDIAGRVVAPDGMGLAEVVVALDELSLPQSELEERRSVPVQADDRPQARTDASGAFLFAGAPAGFVRLAAGREDFRTTFSAPIEVRAGQTSGGVELVLEPLDAGAEIAGIVLDPAGEPVPFAELQYRYCTRLGRGSGSFRAGPDGRFRLEAKRGAAQDLSASDPRGRLGLALAQDVEPGTTNLVLRLAPPREVELLVRASDGRPVERFQVTTTDEDGLGGGGWSLATSPLGSVEEGEVVAPPSALHPGGRVRLAPRMPRFRVTVEAEGYDLAEAGPFEVARQPRIEVVLRPLPGVSGRVVSGGRGVAAAEIEVFERLEGTFQKNGLPLRFHPEVRARAVTDGDGAFALTLRRAGDFMLLAAAPGLATGELELDGFEPERGRAGLELAPVAGGTIEGRVLVPAGRSPAGTIVAFSRGDGRAFTRRVGPDGGYRAEGLTPGRWEVRALEEEIREGSGSTEVSSSAGGEVPWNCEVADGRVTRIDLDHGGARPEVELLGRVMLDGAPAGGWKAELGPGTPGQTRSGLQRGQLDADGRFRLPAQGPGPATLILTAIGGALDGLRLVQPLELRLGENERALDLALARIEVEDAGADRQLALVWLGGGGAFALRPVLDAGGAAVAVPAGRIKLLRFDEEQRDPDPRRWPALDETEVAPGGLAKLDARP